MSWNKSKEFMKLAKKQGIELVTVTDWIEFRDECLKRECHKDTQKVVS